MGSRGLGDTCGIRGRSAKGSRATAAMRANEVLETVRGATQ